MSTSKERLEYREALRRSEHKRAREDWDRLTKDRDEWPEDEHQARFEAITRLVMFSRPRK